MAFDYIGIEEAIARPGLRMVVVGGVPSPWGEAAKGILHVKGIAWSAVRLAYDSEALKQWTGGLRNGPVAFYADERPRSGWAEILLLAERLAPAPALLPADAAERALVMGLAHEICGEGGLGWTRRLQLVHAGLQGSGGFAARAAQYLGRKYGYRAEAADALGPRVHALLGMLAQRLRMQQAAGSAYLAGTALTAADIYCATAMALFAPLPPAVCAMDEATRAAFASLDAPTAAALDPLLLAHRDAIYARHLVLPLAL
jgi:glutathione S-transferase